MLYKVIYVDNLGPLQGPDTGRHVRWEAAFERVVAAFDALATARTASPAKTPRPPAALGIRLSSPIPIVK